LEDPTGRSKEDLLRKKKSRQSDQKNSTRDVSTCVKMKL
jgi:hypothetical protein